MLRRRRRRRSPSGQRPSANLRADDIALFFTNILEYTSPSPPPPPRSPPCARASPGFEQIGFELMQAMDNPGSHLHAIESISGVVDILSALVNFLHFRQDKLAALDPVVQEFGGSAEQIAEFRARIAEISQADFQLIQQSQENSKLLSKIVHSPEKLQKNLEKKKGVRDELKMLEKMAMHKFLEKNNALEMYTKACDKLLKHLSKISALHETVRIAAKPRLVIKVWRLRPFALKLMEVHEAKDHLKAKEKERDQRIADNKQKMSALKSQFEPELKCLADRERETEEKIAKAADLCSQADAVDAAGKEKCEEILAAFDLVCETANLYMDGIDRSIKQFDEATLAITGQRGA